jgi:hypothetical protein
MIEASPAPDTGIRAIRANNPARANQAITQTDSLRKNARNRGPPQEAGTELCGAFDHEAMQRSAADGKAAVIAGESCIRRRGGANKTNAAEWMSVGQGHVNPKALQCRASVGHQAFAAGLVDWGLRTVRYQHPEPALARRDRGCQSSRAASNHEDVGRVGHALTHNS